jgi:hypothetical protein
VGKKPLDRALPNDEAKLRELYGRMKTHGPVLRHPLSKVLTTMPGSRAYHDPNEHSRRGATKP